VTIALRISLGIPIALLALVLFAAAMLTEWLGDLARSCPHSENTK
jgi:hypothetical protein